MRKEKEEKQKTEEVVHARHDLWAVDKPPVLNEGDVTNSSDESDASTTCAY